MAFKIWVSRPTGNWTLHQALYKDSVCIDNAEKGIVEGNERLSTVKNMMSNMLLFYDFCCFVFSSIFAVVLYQEMGQMVGKKKRGQQEVWGWEQEGLV